MNGLKSTLKSEGGAVLVLVAVCLVVLIGMAALAIDLGQLYVARQRAQNVCDAAALAGAPFLTGSSDCTALDGPAATAARKCAAANNETVSSWQLNGLQVTFPLEVFYDYDRDTPVPVELGEAIRAEGYVTVNFGFARIFGFDTKDVAASATAVLGPARRIPSNPLIPISLSDQISYQDYEFGHEYEFGVVPQWQEGFLGPGNWLSLRFEGDSGEKDYINRLAGDSDPVAVSVGGFVNTEPGGAGGEGGQSKTYEGLIAKSFSGPNAKNPGRILRETNPAFQALQDPPEYYHTGYNPDAWDNWLNAKDPVTGMYPYCQRIVILPIIKDTPEAINGMSTLEVVGFAAFFITRVYDGEGETYDDQGLLRLKGDLQGYFIQAVVGTSGDFHWVFPAEGTEVDDPDFVRIVRLIS